MVIYLKKDAAGKQILPEKWILIFLWTACELRKPIHSARYLVTYNPNLWDHLTVPKLLKTPSKNAQTFINPTPHPSLPFIALRFKFFKIYLS